MLAGRSDPKMPIRTTEPEARVVIRGRRPRVQQDHRLGRHQTQQRRCASLVLDGGASELHLQVQPFDSAAEQFIEWCKGEYRDHSNCGERLRTSLTSAKIFFGSRPLSSIANAGDVEDYESWRRTNHRVRQVTLRHDLHAQSCSSTALSTTGARSIPFAK